MALLPFVKVEGLGNDFLVVDLRPGKPAHPLADVVTNPETVRALCDRNFGVGGDGCLAILPGSQGDARMRVLNADGSEAEMCGNGIRCVAKVLHDQDPAVAARDPAHRHRRGAARCKIDTQEPRNERDRGNGRAATLARLIPVASDAPRLVRAPLRAQDRDFAFTAVSMGNPHAVIFVDDPPPSCAILPHFGPGIERDPLFPRRTNVEFASVRKGASGRARDRSGGVGARLRHHPRVRNGRLCHRGGGLPGRRIPPIARFQCIFLAARSSSR
jgi:diaminopimelate epimerase